MLTFAGGRCGYSNFCATSPKYISSAKLFEVSECISAMVVYFSFLSRQTSSNHVSEIWERVLEEGVGLTVESMYSGVLS